MALFETIGYIMIESQPTLGENQGLIRSEFQLLLTTPDFIRTHIPGVNLLHPPNIACTTNLNPVVQEPGRIRVSRIEFDQRNCHLEVGIW